MVSPNSVTAVEEGRFLGYEFLTYLWFSVENERGKIQVGEREAELSLGEQIGLTLPSDGKEKVVCSTQANQLTEARAALQQGKLVGQIQLILKVGDNEYVFSLESSLATIRGLKTPKQLPNFDEEDPDGRFLEKMFFIEEVHKALDGFYARFLSERLSAQWEAVSLPMMRNWIQGEVEVEDAAAR